jgi:hypothetical protein
MSGTQLIAFSRTKHWRHPNNNEITEFLTHETTCASEMLEKTTCENFCQKRPPTSGGTPGQATRGTCRLGQCRQAPAAVAVAVAGT